jgi:hypothetical protein
MPERPNIPDDPDAPPTEEELKKAEDLRAALDDPAARSSADADLARALRAAWAPSDLSSQQHRRILRAALTKFDERKVRRGRFLRVASGAGAVVALAAGVAAVFWTERHTGQPPLTSAAVAMSRSTQSLFDEHFAPTGGETSRIDRIVLAREADLRDNEFARWGVR